ncbi:MAG: zinc dependent phospholipase C family protein [Bacteroidota bacterium]
MSGPAIHHVVAKRFLDEYLKQKYTDVNSTNFWNKMESGDFAPPFHLGAQGPDFLFFNMSDWPMGGAIKTVAQVYGEVEEFLADVVEKIKSVVPQALWDAIAYLDTLADTAVERSATLSEIAQLTGDVQNNIDAIKTIVMTKIEEYITSSYDLFSLVSHPQQQGQDYPEWWWFDAMHIRRTGKFTEALLKYSSHGTMERAYALGYLTHYAADVVGHPFVNAVAGGPYRTHGQRHKVVENHQDVWAFDQYMGREFITSNLASEYVINGNPNELPSGLKDLILKSIQKVYYKNGVNVYGKNIQGSDLDIAYKFWLKWFTGATNSMALPAPKPYSLTAEVVECWEKFKDNAGDVLNYMGSSSSGGFSIWGFFEALAALILGPFLLAAALVDFLLGLVTTLGAAPIRFLLSLSYEALYNAYQNLRQGLVLNGFAFPPVSQLGHYMTKHMVKTSEPDIFGHNANSLPLAACYPALKFKLGSALSESHLVYPFPVSVNKEPDKATGFPSSYFGKFPSWYIDNPRNIYNRERDDYFRNFIESGAIHPTPVELDTKYTQLGDKAKQAGLGNAIAFSDALYTDFLTASGRRIADFSLDSDKGYAFKCFRKVKDISYINKPINSFHETNVEMETSKTVLNIVTDIIDPNTENL